jgi:hypothetical protein
MWMDVHNFQTHPLLYFSGTAPTRLLSRVDSLLLLILFERFLLFTASLSEHKGRNLF